MVKKRPVQESVILPLQRQKKEIKTEDLMEEINALNKKILILEKISLPRKQMDANEGDFEEEMEKKIRRMEDQFWKAEEKIVENAKKLEEIRKNQEEEEQIKYN